MPIPLQVIRYQDADVPDVRPGRFQYVAGLTSVQGSAGDLSGGVTSRDYTHILQHGRAGSYGWCVFHPVQHFKLSV